MVDEVVLRQHIMARLADVTQANGGFVSRQEISSFTIEPGVTRRLVDTSKGIWNPRDLAATLSVVSSPDGPYADEEVEDGLFHYDYRSGSHEGDNRKLRNAFEMGLPIILLRKIEAGVFVPIFPVYVIGDDTAARQFVLALDETLRFLEDPLNPSPAERRYAERVVKQRLHQPEFRGRVIHAYATHCTICTLAIGDLLDAAHIVGDTHELGQPVTQNGLSLCKIHHAAFDKNLLGITPDLEVQVNRELLDLIDGPMLRHGLQEMHGRRATAPHRHHDHPDPVRLDLRYADFLNAQPAGGS